LKQQACWATISQAQDAIALIALIKTITFCFEDQKFLPLALYQLKANLYNIRQGTMPNNDYLQGFQNLVDVSSAYNGQLYNTAIVNICNEKVNPSVDYRTLSDDQKSVIHTAALELYQAMIFLHQSDKLSLWQTSRGT
jgi:hypothetical protein